MPHSQKMSGIHESLLLQFLSTWNGNHHSKKYIYLTLEAAKILLPKMCVPQVPFALAVADEELKALCVSSLSRSLQFEAI